MKIFGYEINIFRRKMSPEKFEKVFSEIRALLNKNYSDNLNLLKTSDTAAMRVFLSVKQIESMSEEQNKEITEWTRKEYEKFRNFFRGRNAQYTIVETIFEDVSLSDGSKIRVYVDSVAVALPK